jgi:hypothetical protein
VLVRRYVFYRLESGIILGYYPIIPFFVEQSSLTVSLVEMSVFNLASIIPLDSKVVIRVLAIKDNYRSNVH